MKLIDLIPIQNTSRISIVGAGAKTSVLYALAKAYQQPIILTTSTRVSLEEASIADEHINISKPVDFLKVAGGLTNNLTFFSSQIKAHQVKGLSDQDLLNLEKLATIHNYPIIIEADGAKDLWLKAPAYYEPPIPEFTDHVIVCVNSNIFGHQLNDGNVHRPEIVSLLLNLSSSTIVDEKIVADLISHPSGGMKNIPQNAKITLFINGVDSVEKENQANRTKEFLQENTRITNCIQGNISYHQDKEENIKQLI